MPLLFSYGTLQQEDVQLATFGRRLTGAADALVGYRQSMVKIDDPEVVRTSGKTHHPIVAFTGKGEDRVPGALFEISDAELAHADAYEVGAYVRIEAQLASGLKAWVYVDRRGQPPAGAGAGAAGERYIAPTMMQTGSRERARSAAIPRLARMLQRPSAFKEP
jgi:gamma-glutamylcyclotransferase (GGCT)/AIG2-like uncharacterized protein YtfP